MNDLAWIDGRWSSSLCLAARAAGVRGATAVGQSQRVPAMEEAFDP